MPGIFFNIDGIHWLSSSRALQAVGDCGATLVETYWLATVLRSLRFFRLLIVSLARSSYVFHRLPSFPHLFDWTEAYQRMKLLSSR